MDTFFNFVFWGNTVKTWLVAAGCVVVLFIAIRLFKHLVLKRIATLALRTESNFDDLLVTVLEKTLVPLAYLLSIYAGIKVLDTNVHSDRVIDGAAMVVITWSVLRLMTSAAGFFFKRYMLRQPGETREKQGRGILMIFNIVLWIADFIIVEDKMGSIEYIGIKTTLIRTLSGEQLICSNSKLTSSWVHNYKRMDLRRIVFSFGLTFQTPVEKVKAVPG
jgi:hypothetical protein